MTDIQDTPENEQAQVLLAKHLLSEYREFHQTKVPTIMNALIAELELYGKDAARYLKAIKAIQSKHEKHELDVLKIYSEFEASKKKRENINESQNQKYIVIIDEQEPQFQEWRKQKQAAQAKLPTNEPKLIEPDQIEKE